VNKGIIYPDLSYKIMQAVFAVHNELEPGFMEKVYEGALVYELQKSGFAVARQQVRSYLKASGLKLGILINFGTKRIQSTRIAN